MIIALLVFSQVTVLAVPVSVPSTGSRSTPSSSGVVAFDGWTEDNDGFKIEWDISSTDSRFLYTYTFTDNVPGSTTISPGISHLILEVSRDLPEGDIQDVEVWPAEGDEDVDADWEGPKWWASSGDSNPNPSMPNVDVDGDDSQDIFGIKIEAAPPEGSDEGGPELRKFQFTSSRLPMWGDFYTKDGFDRTTDEWAAAYNTGFGTDPTVDDDPFTNWIPVPDTEGGAPPQEFVIPEPSTIVLLGLGLSGLAIVVRRRKRA